MTRLLPQVSVTTDVASPALGLCSEPLHFPALQKEPPGHLNSLPLGGEVWSRWVMKPTSPVLSGEGAVDKGWACGGTSILLGMEVPPVPFLWVSSIRRNCRIWARAGSAHLGETSAVVCESSLEKVYPADSWTLTLSHCHLLYHVLYARLNSE